MMGSRLNLMDCVLLTMMDFVLKFTDVVQCDFHGCCTLQVSTPRARPAQAISAGSISTQAPAAQMPPTLVATTLPNLRQ